MKGNYGNYLNIPLNICVCWKSALFFSEAALIGGGTKDHKNGQAGTSIVRSSTVTRHAAPMGQCTGPHLCVGSIYYNAEVYPYSVWRAPPERGGLPSVQ